MMVTTVINDSTHWVYILPIFAPLAFLIWIWFDTYYKVENGVLKYKSAFIRGSISIAEIKKISTNTTFFVGLKPALSSKGLIIKFKKWDEIYISPENELLFFKELLKVNPSIEIEYRE